MLRNQLAAVVTKAGADFKNHRNLAVHDAI